MSRRPSKGASGGGGGSPTRAVTVATTSSRAVEMKPIRTYASSPERWSGRDSPPDSYGEEAEAASDGQQRSHGRSGSSSDRIERFGPADHSAPIINPADRQRLERKRREEMEQERRWAEESGYATYDPAQTSKGEDESGGGGGGGGAESGDNRCCSDQCLNTTIPFVGNVLEWFDFAVFGYLTATLSEVFFPATDPVAATMSTFSVFAGAFFMRPIGGLIFGHIGDTIGRKRALLASIVLMACSTTAMACLPGYDQVGVAAPILLTLVRLLQGVSIGGQLVGTFVHAVETAPKGQEVLKGAYTFAGASLGTALGSLVAAVLQESLDEVALVQWGWRIPFAMGLLVGVFTVAFRDRIHESPVVPARVKNPIRVAFCEHCGLLTKLVIILGYFACSFYFVAIWIVTFIDTMRFPVVPYASTINTVLMLGHVCLFHVFGKCIDPTGHRRRYIIAGTAAVGVLIIPSLLLLDMWDIGDDPCANLTEYNQTLLKRSGPWDASNYTPCEEDTSHDAQLVVITIVVQGTLLALVTLSSAPMPVYIVQHFRSEIRYTAVAIAYNVAQAVFGGTTPLVATALMSATGSECSNPSDPCPQQSVWVAGLFPMVLAVLSCAVMLEPEIKRACCWGTELDPSQRLRTIQEIDQYGFDDSDVLDDDMGEDDDGLDEALPAAGELRELESQPRRHSNMLVI